MSKRSSPTTILYLHSNSEIGGGNKVLLRLVERLDRNQYKPFALIPDPGPFEAELKNADVKYAIIDTRTNKLSRLQSLINIAKIAMARRIQRAQLLHSNEFPYRLGAFGCRGIKRICHLHHPGFDKATLAWLLKVPPHLIITPSYFVRDEVARCLAGTKINCPIQVVWNSIDTDWFRPASSLDGLRQQLKLDPTERHVCILGTLVKHKGHECFLEAAKLILKSYPQTRFHVVGGERPGNSEYPLKLQRLTEQLGIAENVKFWGLVEDTLARDVLAASDLFMLPTEEEGFGLVVAEAQACEVPAITTRIRPLNEVVEDGRTGFLVERTAAAFAESAIALLSDDGKRRAMGVAGRKWVEQRFGIESFVTSMLSFYKQLLLPTGSER